MINADEFADALWPRLVEFQSLSEEHARTILANAIREVQIDVMGNQLAEQLAEAASDLPEHQVGRFVQTDEGLSFDVR